MIFQYKLHVEKVEQQWRGTLHHLLLVGFATMGFQSNPKAFSKLTRSADNQLFFPCFDNRYWARWFITHHKSWRFSTYPWGTRQWPCFFWKYSVKYVQNGRIPYLHEFRAGKLERPLMFSASLDSYLLELLQLFITCHPSFIFGLGWLAWSNTVHWWDWISCARAFRKSNTITCD